MKCRRRANPSCGGSPRNSDHWPLPHQTRHIAPARARLHSSSEWPALLHRRHRAIAAGWRRHPRAICTWVTPGRSGQPSSARVRRAARWSCAWRIWTPTAAAPTTPTPRWRTCDGWASAGRRAPTRAAHSLLTCRASAAPSTWLHGASWCTAADCFPAVARAKTWRLPLPRRMSACRGDRRRKVRQAGR